MLEIDNDFVVCFDVDDTIVLWDHPGSDDTINGYPVKIHKKHVALIKKYHARGQFVIVWSKGGVEWTKAVVRALVLEDYVDMVIRKPDVCYDDKPPHFWLDCTFQQE